MLRSYLTARANGRNRRRRDHSSCGRRWGRPRAKGAVCGGNVIRPGAGDWSREVKRFGDFTGCDGRDGRTFDSWNSLPERDR